MKKFNVLFLCSGNSCRSQMAEAILRKLAPDKFNAFSAGSNPNLEEYKKTKGVHPIALNLLKKNNYPTEKLYSKDWKEFVKHADDFHFAFTLCDKTKSEIDSGACPIFPGQPMTAHWGIIDPAYAVGTEEEVKAEFLYVFTILQKRISIFVNLPVDSLENIALQQKLDDIGKIKE